jgi:FMN phosphatase YigB (HAD superfamily)
VVDPHIPVIGAREAGRMACWVNHHNFPLAIALVPAPMAHAAWAK